MFKTAIDSVSSVLKGNDGTEFCVCESMSLRLEKFVRIGEKDAKKDEIVAVVTKTAQQVPTFVPPNAISFVAQLGGRLIVNQTGGILENAGLCFHPHFNTPYIPGSALKGVARHAAWRAWNEEQDTEKKSALAKEIADIFGYPTNDKKLDEYLANIRYDRKHSGSVCFMPSYPEATAKLVTDIITPHGGNDWTTPIPSTFPAVERGATFVFSVCPINNNSACDIAVKWLKCGICEHGVGAKTNAGYGRFIVEGYGRNHDAIVKLHFASPAFLRGAEGDEGSLRIATLRGLMRWWWRWIYRNALSERDLAILEKKIWGGCAGGASASCISLGFVSQPSVTSVPYDKNNRTPKNHQKQMATSGLAYLSYGMDEKVHGELKRRRVLDAHPSKVWELAIDALPHDSGLSKEQLLKHARHALWALCNYGGVGSKARKGFGSLCCDIEYKDINAVFEEVYSSLQSIGLKVLDVDDIDVPYATLTSSMDSVKTKSRDSWYVLDRIGYAFQKVAVEYKHNGDKAVIGLPRKIHGPKMEPMKHQLGHRHQLPKKLIADNVKCDRFTSPIAIHLKDLCDGIEVNITAFPSDKVRDIVTSEKIIKKCVNNIRSVLEEI